MNQGFGPLALPDLPHVEVPVGWKCLQCQEDIGPWDSGRIMPMLGEEGARLVAVHLECEIRSAVGSVGHQRGLCSCPGNPGTLDDPPGVSKRVAALLAVMEMHRAGRLKHELRDERDLAVSPVGKMHP